MGNAICKLWTFLLNLIQKAVEAIAYALKTIGEVVIPLLGQLADAVGGAIGSIFGGGNLLVWLGVGVFAYFLLTKEDDSGGEVVVNTLDPSLNSSNGG